MPKIATIESELPGYLKDLHAPWDERGRVLQSITDISKWGADQTLDDITPSLLFPSRCTLAVQISPKSKG